MYFSRKAERIQHSDARPARLGQNHAGQANADDPARPDARRIDRDHARLQRRGPSKAGPAAVGRPAVPIAASYHQQCGLGRRRFHALARRNFAGAQRCAFSR